MINFLNNNPILNRLKAAILFIDVNKKILYMNEKFVELTGFNKSQLIGKEYDIILKQSVTTHVSPILHFLRQGKIGILSNYILMNKDNKSILIDINSIPFSDSKKDIAGSCLMIIPKITHYDEKSDDVFCDSNMSKYGLIGDSSSMHEVSYLIKTVAPTDATVLILGETGTGKEIVADIVYKLSSLSNEKFKIINCATLSENLLENELFGHEKDSYTGATATYKGIFETTMNGTVFLDEIGEISLKFQAKLLRILESGEYSRIGSVETRKTNVRIITATNRDLKKMVKEKKFREDLYYRLNIFPIHIPPLRERIMDMPLIINYLIENLNKKYKKSKTGISDIALTFLFGYSFPGNIRELKNIIEHSYIKSNDKIIQDYDLPIYLLDEMQQNKSSNSNQKIEAKIIYLMKKFKGNKSKVAKALSISRKTLYNKLAAMDYDFME